MIDTIILKRHKKSNFGEFRQPICGEIGDEELIGFTTRGVIEKNHGKMMEPIDKAYDRAVDKKGSFSRGQSHVKLYS